MLKKLRKLLKKMYSAKPKKVPPEPWTPWCSNIGRALVQARLEGRWKEKEAA